MKSGHKNKNCMIGLRCPRCGEDDAVMVYASAWMRIIDEGVDTPEGAIDYDEQSMASCPECNHCGSFKDWEIAHGSDPGSPCQCLGCVENILNDPILNYIADESVDDGF